jgi:hypothetical protein
VELDCAHNRHPDAVEISLHQLGEWMGLDGPATRKTVLAIRKLQLLACFLPESDEEEALLKVRTPLETPLSITQIQEFHPHLFGPHTYFRYVSAHPELEKSAEDSSSPPALQEVIDLYFDAIGLKMNSFVLDELRLLCQKFEISEIRGAFHRSKKQEIRNLAYVVGILAKARGQRPTKDSENIIPR